MCKYILFHNCEQQQDLTEAMRISKLESVHPIAWRAAVMGYRNHNDSLLVYAIYQRIGKTGE